MITNKKNILFVGGSSKICSEFIKNINSNCNNIFLVSRKKNKLKQHNVHDLSPINITLPNDLLNLKNKLAKYKFDSIIFNNGLCLSKELIDYNFEDIQEVFHTNIISTVFILNLFISSLKRGSKVIFISSISSVNGSFDEVYSSSKSAIDGLMISLAKKYGEKITFNIISPGTILSTNMSKNISKATLEKHLAQTPTKMLNTPKNIALAMISLLSSSWVNVNGQNIFIDGGRSL